MSSDDDPIYGGHRRNSPNGSSRSAYVQRSVTAEGRYQGYTETLTLAAQRAEKRDAFREKAKIVLRRAGRLLPAKLRHEGESLAVNTAAVMAFMEGCAFLNLTPAGWIVDLALLVGVASIALTAGDAIEKTIDCIRLIDRAKTVSDPLLDKAAQDLADAITEVGGLIALMGVLRIATRSRGGGGGAEDRALPQQEAYRDDPSNPARVVQKAPVEPKPEVVPKSETPTPAKPAGQNGAVGGNEGAENGPRFLSPPGFVELDEFNRLNVPDPAIGKVRPGEASAAAELQQLLGGKVSRLVGPSGADFIFTEGPQAGKTVDFLLTPSTDREAAGINKFFAKNADGFFDNLALHLAKADIVPVDSRFLTPENKEALMGMVKRLPVADQGRIIIFK